MAEIKYEFMGTRYSRRNKNFTASVSHGKKVYYCGSAKTEREAVKLRDLTIIRHNLPKEKLQILKPKEE